jgi:hypothetical protein
MSELAQAIAEVELSVVELAATPDFCPISNNQWNPWIVLVAAFGAIFYGISNSIRNQCPLARWCRCEGNLIDDRIAAVTQNEVTAELLCLSWWPAGPYSRLARRVHDIDGWWRLVEDENSIPKVTT